MRTIYIDADFKCHAVSDGTMAAVNTDFFDGKCDAYVEGFRFVPTGKTWTREDGVAFTGEMIAPWKDFSLLAAYQEQYETIQAELDAAYREGVNSV